MSIAERVGEVAARIAAAAAGAGRSPQDVMLVAVTKTVNPERIREAVDAGVKHLGENRVQEALSKLGSLPEGVTLHMIGHLQTNKARQVACSFDWIHSVDSVKLAEELSRRCDAAGRRLTCLLEVNVSGEEAKYGATPEDAARLADCVAALPSLELAGLMTVPPFSEDPESSRPHFARLRGLAASLAPNLPAGSMRHLSMGMTGDYEVAVEEGATIVRVGTAIFGHR
ncbi:MAG TPA: YggS family pyridoxal phosphate-dependent enzyme [Alphaproteobacteria bacterium]|nr:YggS family pyridoxal phosphate-dependent enzyme [Alphaproteobacteria bacterium]